MRIVFSILLLCLGLSVSCRNYPTSPEPDPSSGTATGQFYGNGRFSDVDANVSLNVVATDTLGHYSGQIRYLGYAAELTGISLSASEDTLRFGYTRSSITYVVRARVTSAGLTAVFDEPSGTPVLQLNRANGRNMTGMWTGRAQSDLSGYEGDAAMIMDQAGSLYYGTVTLSQLTTYQLQITTGSTGGNAFLLGGTFYANGTNFNVDIGGQYFGSDTLTAGWSLGSSGSVDHGGLVLYRRFQ